MMMHACASSTIKAYGYDRAKSVFAVQFHAGGEYHYKDVPEDVFEGFLMAYSKGSYHHHHIKGKYEIDDQATYPAPSVRRTNPAVSQKD